MDDISYLPIITRQVSEKVFIRDIVLILREGRKLRIWTADGGETAVYGKMDQASRFLDGRFCPAMAGLVLNLDMVKKMEGDRVEFLDGRAVSMGRDSYVRTRQRFNIYLRERAASYQAGAEGRPGIPGPG